MACKYTYTPNTHNSISSCEVNTQKIKHYYTRFCKILLITHVLAHIFFQLSILLLPPKVKQYNSNILLTASGANTDSLFSMYPLSPPPPN